MRRTVLFLVLLYLLQSYRGLTHAQEAAHSGKALKSTQTDGGTAEAAAETHSSPAQESTSQRQPGDDATAQPAPEGQPASSSPSEREETALPVPVPVPAAVEVEVTATAQDSDQPSSAAASSSSSSSSTAPSSSVSSASTSSSPLHAAGTQSSARADSQVSPGPPSRGDIEPTSVTDVPQPTTPQPELVADTSGLQLQLEGHQPPPSLSPDVPAPPSSQADAKGSSGSQEAPSPAAAQPEVVPQPQEEKQVGASQQGTTAQAEASVPDKAPAEEAAGGLTEEKTEEAAAPEPERKTEEKEGEEAAAPSPGEEDFPSFAEWRQKVLEEQEKIKLENQNAGTPAPLPSTKLKLRMNYASKNCGAKILASNPEAENTKGVLTSNRDDYMINPCTAKKWFHVELCEPVQVKSVEVASLELFSSRPKAFRIFVSDRYPVKEWRSVGTYETTEERVTQSFQINDSAFVKFLRVEIPEHHGSEHYCPVTFFRVFGIEMADDDDDENQEAPGDPEHSKADQDSAYVPLVDSADTEDEGEAATSLFNSAKDTVVNLVKKVLYTGEGEGKAVEPPVDNATEPEKDGEAKSAGGSDADVSTPCEIQTDTKTADVPTVVIPSPTVEESKVSSAITPSPTELPMVTKLEDNEQVPHVHAPDGLAASGLGPGSHSAASVGDRVFSCRSQSWRLAPRDCCSHRSLCSYVELMLGSVPPAAASSLQSCGGGGGGGEGGECEASSSSSSASSLRDPGASESVIVETPFVTHVDESTQAVGVSSTGEQREEASATTPATQGGSTMTSEAAYASPGSVAEEAPENQGKEPAETEVRPTMTSGAVSTATTQSPGSSEAGDSSVSGESAPSSAAEGTASAPAATQESPPESKTAASVGTASSEPGPPLPPSDQGQTTTVSQELPPLEPSEPILAEGESPVDASPTPSLDSRVVLTTTGVAGSGESSDTQATGAERGSSEASSSSSSSSDIPSVIIPPLMSLISTPTPPPQPTLSEASATTQAGGEETRLEATGETEVAPSSTPVVEQEQGVQPSNATATVTPSPSQQQQPQQPPPSGRAKDLVHVPPMATMKRETAISRLTNRIKALELNVSLSSRFLDELSQRFKKQNEEMMKLLNKTIQRFNNASQVAERRDQRQQEQLDMLESRMDNLTTLVLQLSDTVSSIQRSLHEMNQFWGTVQVLLILSVLVMCLWRRKADALAPELQRLLDSMPQHPSSLSINPRRNSDITPATRRAAAAAVGSKRKSSDTALDTLASSDTERDTVNISIVEPEDVLLINAETSKKKKKRKQKSFDARAAGPEEVLHRSASASSASSAHLNTSAGLLFSVGGEEWERQSHTKQSRLGQAPKAPHKLSLGTLPSQHLGGGSHHGKQQHQHHGKSATAAGTHPHHHPHHHTQPPPFQRGHKRSNSHGKEGRRGGGGGGGQYGGGGGGGAPTSASSPPPQGAVSAKYCLGRNSLPSAEARGRGGSFMVLERGSTVCPDPPTPRRPPQLNGAATKKVQGCLSIGTIVNGGSFGHYKKNP